MVYGIIGMINFAHGDVYMIAAYVAAIVMAVLLALGFSSTFLVVSLALVVAMFVAATYGWAIERVAYKPLRGSDRLAPVISAIGISLILQNYVQLSQGARLQGVPTLIEGSLSVGQGDNIVQISYTQFLIVVIALASMLALSALINKTSLGRACRSTQQDMVMASILGVNVDRTIAMVFAIGAAMAAVAGVLVTMNYGTFDFYIGFVTGIKAFTAAVLGGIGSLPGAMLGGIFLGLSESLFSGLINTDYKDVFAFSVLVLVLIFRPHGLLGRPEVEKV